MMPKKLWIWNLVLMFLPLVITLMILPHLPNQIPAHYGFDGQVDRWGSKYETLVVPLLAVITGGILLLAAKFAGKAEDGGQNNRRVTLLGSIIALLVFNAMTLFSLHGHGAGYRLNCAAPGPVPAALRPVGGGHGDPRQHHAETPQELSRGFAHPLEPER